MFQAVGGDSPAEKPYIHFPLQDKADQRGCIITDCKYTNTNTQIQKYKYTRGTFPFAWQGRPLGLHHHRLQTYIICIELQAVRVCGVCGIHNTHIIPQIRLAELKSCNSTRAPNQAYKDAICNSTRACLQITSYDINVPNVNMIVRKPKTNDI